VQLTFVLDVLRIVNANISERKEESGILIPVLRTVR